MSNFLMFILAIIVIAVSTYGALHLLVFLTRRCKPEDMSITFQDTYEEIQILQNRFIEKGMTEKEKEAFSKIFDLLVSLETGEVNKEEEV